MINSYSCWKYCGIFLVFIVGCIYTLPNFYGENFAVFVTQQILDTQSINNNLLFDVKQALKNNKITNKSISLTMNSIQIYFFSASDQLHAYEILSSLFSEKYVISHKKVLSMPNWLFWIKASPVKLGLDLKGGLRLIACVDVKTVLNKFQEQSLDILKSNLFEKKIPYLRIGIAKNYVISILFQDFSTKNQAISYLSQMNQNLRFYSLDDCTLNVVFSKDYISTIHEYIMKQNMAILRHRINQLQITEPMIQRYGNNGIVVELPGIQDISKIKSILSSTVSLEFRLINTEINKFIIDNNLIPEDSEIKLDKSGNIVPLYKKVILTGNHIINSSISFDEYHRPQVNISLDKIGSSIISKFTADNIGKLIATLLIEYKDTGIKNSQGHPIWYKYDKIINIATIQSQLIHNFCITGINNLNEARHLSSLLRMGSLVAPIYIEEERMIGPILGKKNIKQGAVACSLGILISICFMVFWYRYFGLIAGVALIANLIFMVSLMSLIPGVVLTMPSIAGIVLTLSVAIDSNVLINERIKEEIKQGKPIQYSIYSGYRKAFTTIVDSNITTIIASVILYIISTGSIQGFAIITIIGVGTSMFTSIIGTRSIVNLVYGKKYIKKLSI